MTDKNTKSQVLPASQVTMKQVAEAAGVGVGTVSRVVNHSSGVAKKTKLKVENAISQLGFNPNPIAQSMRSGQTKIFACVVRDFSVPILSAFVNAMQAVVDNNGYGLQVVSSYHDPVREGEILRKLALRRTDGIVLASSSEDDKDLLATIRGLNVPVVLLDRDIPEELDAVLIDHRYGMRSAVSHLLDLGHRKIAMISGEAGLRPVQERLRGAREAFASKGLTLPPDFLRAGSFSADYAYSEVSQLLREPNRCTAIIAAGTGMLVGVLKAIRDANLKIPDDISLISGADNELAQLHTPTIATIKWEHDKLGAAAGKLLLDRLKNPKLRAARIVFPTELIVRNSCGIPTKNITSAS